LESTIFQDFINSRVGMAVGLALSRMPPKIGYRFARWLGTRIGTFKSLPMVTGVRANQWVINDMAPTSRELDALAVATFQSVVRSLYEFWHFNQDDDAIKGMVDFDQSFVSCYEHARQAKTGLILVVPHLSNFDLVGRAAVLNGFPLHILSYPQPSGGYRWQNRLRELPGLTVTPFSVNALHQASQTLMDGGAVVTGIDRPLADVDTKYRSRFFGRPANLPVYHIRLALKHELPVIVTGGIRKPNGRYLVWASDPIPMIPHPDLVQETVQNAEAVLAVLAGFIKRAKEQWAMFYPVWPEVLEDLPM